jgi:hypothetical protein
MRHLFFLALLALAPAAGFAQEYSAEEIIVTGTRIQRDDDEDRLPVIGLTRTADFAVQQVTIDARRAETPRRDIRNGPWRDRARRPARRHRPCNRFDLC